MNGQESFHCLGESYSSPTRNNSLITSGDNFQNLCRSVGPVNTSGAIFSNRATQLSSILPMPEHKTSYHSIISPSFKNNNMEVAASLTSYSPPLAPKSPVMSDIPAFAVGNTTFEDPLMMLHWLTQIDILRPSPKFSNEQNILPKRSTSNSSTTSSSFSIPAVEHFSRMEGEFMEAVRRKNHQRVPYSSQISSETYSSQSSRSSSPLRRPDTPSTPKGKKSVSSSIMSSPNSPGTPRVPYKGRFGSTPVCGSCKSSKTPYWRDSWSKSFILCNACGLRYAKFKRYCNECSYVPRKDDKSASCCTQCSSPWSYKSY